MCNFKSGIIFKNRVVIAPEDNDSHSDLLDSLGVEDSEENALTKFVRAELLSKNDEWWTNPINWKFNVDQDIVPDWFNEDKEKYEAEFRTSVTDWWNEHVIVNKKIEALKTECYWLYNSKVKILKGDATIIEMRGNSTIEEMHDNSIVKRMYDDSIINNMCDKSTVNETYNYSTIGRMSGNSTVEEMWNNSIVKIMYDDSTIRRMSGNSTVEEMYNHSTVEEMYNHSIVKAMYNHSIVKAMYNHSIVKAMHDYSSVEVMHDDSMAKCNWKHKILLPTSNGTFEIEPK